MATITLKEYSYIAFFDLDRTIGSAISGNALTRRAYKKGLMSRSDMIRAIYLSLGYKIGIINPEKIINEMVGWVKGLPEDTISQLCMEVFNEVLLPSFFPEINNEIEFHKKNNAKLVVLSSSLAPICRYTVKHLKMDDIVCSELEVKNGILTGFPVRPLCFGVEKAVRLKEYCEKNNSNPKDCWYYGDSISDLAVLTAVGFPVCVNPDKKLLKTAKKNGWRIEKWVR
jgi:HAD superfamily hydrolase (TIGR01490 family)